MQKKKLSSIELTAIVNELQFLTKGKLTQIYHQEENEILLQLHAREEGKHLLKIVPGKYLCLTKNKSVSLKPSSFCMQLRKHLDNAFIKEIYQKDSERIVVFDLEQKKQKYFLIIELFSRGNVILTDENYMIIGALESQKWKEREVKVKMEYVFPLSGFNWKEISEKKLKEALKKSDKKNLATALATEIGLGGLYAEEICKISNIDPKKEPKDISDREAKLITEMVREFFKKTGAPKGYIYEEQITPFPLSGEEIKSETKTYSEAVDLLNPFRIVSPYEKKIKAMEKMIVGQEAAIENLAEKIELNRKKGEKIYENYPKLQKLLEIVTELRKSRDWSEVAAELKKEKKIKEVDLKNKKIKIEF